LQAASLIRLAEWIAVSAKDWRSRPPGERPAQSTAGRQPTRHRNVALLGLIAFLIAAIDMTTSLVGLSFTSVAWSPLIFMLIGVLLFALESLQHTERPGA
jgi:hypothetical protein